MNYIYEHLNDYKNQNFRSLFLEYFDEMGVVLPSGYDVFEDIALSAVNEGMMTMVAKDNENIIGFIMFQPEKLVSSTKFLTQSTLFIREFCVKSNYRHRGIGQELMNQCFTFAKNHNIVVIILTTTSASNFYIRLGFIEDLSYQAINKQPVYIKHII